MTMKMNDGHDDVIDNMLMMQTLWCRIHFFIFLCLKCVAVFVFDFWCQLVKSVKWSDALRSALSSCCTKVISLQQSITSTIHIKIFSLNRMRDQKVVELRLWDHKKFSVIMRWTSVKRDCYLQETEKTECEWANWIDANHFIAADHLFLFQTIQYVYVQYLCVVFKCTLQCLLHSDR